MSGRVNFDRFREANTADESYECDGCGRVLGFEALSDERFCQRCSAARAEAGNDGDGDGEQSTEKASER